MKNLEFDSEDYLISIVGLGYVGLPLAVEFAKKFSVIGFDIKTERIAELKQCKDSKLEVSEQSLEKVLLSKSKAHAKEYGLRLTSRHEELEKANIFIVTVPTPIDKNNRLVLKPLLIASETVGKQKIYWVIIQKKVQ